MKTTWKDIFRTAANSLQNNSDAEAIATALIEHLSGISKLKLWVERELTPTANQLDTFDLMLEKLNKGEPLQYVLGYAYFLDMKLKVNSAVLIPRPETEELVMLAKNKFASNPPKKVVDFCTGSGCIVLGLKRLFPKSEVIATDVSSPALEVAKRNAYSIFGSQHSITFLEHNLLEHNGIFESGNFDLIISNPPYIGLDEAEEMSKSVLGFEPYIALFAAGEDTIVFYRKLIEIASTSLNKDGILLCEINPIFSQELLHLARQKGFNSSIIKDLSGKERYWEVRRGS